MHREYESLRGPASEGGRRKGSRDREKEDRHDKLKETDGAIPPRSSDHFALVLTATSGWELVMMPRCFALLEGPGR